MCVRISKYCIYHYVHYAAASSLLHEYFFIPEAGGGGVVAMKNELLVIYTAHSLTCVVGKSVE